MATNKSSNPLLAMSAGCVAGGVEATAVWPMEFIKVKVERERFETVYLLELVAYTFLFPAIGIITCLVLNVY